MPKNGIRSTYSQCPVQVRLLDERHEVISYGTAFWFECDGTWHLITNRHNVTGLNNFTNGVIDPQGRRPLCADIMLSAMLESVPPRPFVIAPYRVSFYSDDRQQPLWLEHPELKEKCDIAAFRMPRPDFVPEFMHNAANLISNIQTPVEPGNPVFVIGFPSSISVGFGLPIWKSGFIASEPAYPITLFGKPGPFGAMVGGIKIPAFFIDFRGWHGMSGSPVFASYSGVWNMKEPYEEIDMDAPDFWSRDDIALNGKATEFVGIYSGRMTDPDAKRFGIEPADLGICWTVEAIRATCLSENATTHPHI